MINPIIIASRSQVATAAAAAVAVMLMRRLVIAAIDRNTTTTTKTTLLNVDNKTRYLVKFSCSLLHTTSNVMSPNDRDQTPVEAAKQKIAVCQLTCGPSVEANFDVCRTLIREAASQGAKVFNSNLTTKTNDMK